MTVTMTQIKWPSNLCVLLVSNFSGYFLTCEKYQTNLKNSTVCKCVLDLAIANCPEGFTERGKSYHYDGGGCYMLVKDHKMPMSYAEEYCQSFGNNSHLVSLHDRDETFYVYDLGGRRDNYWTGLRQINTSTGL